MSSAICFNFEQSKILSSGNGLMHHDDEFSSLSPENGSIDETLAGEKRT